jgi:hypothetical protein
MPVLLSRHGAEDAHPYAHGSVVTPSRPWGSLTAASGDRPGPTFNGRRRNTRGKSPASAEDHHDERWGGTVSPTGRRRDGNTSGMSDAVLRSGVSMRNFDGASSPSAPRRGSDVNASIDHPRGNPSSSVTLHGVSPGPRESGTDVAITLRGVSPGPRESGTDVAITLRGVSPGPRESDTDLAMTLRGLHHAGPRESEPDEDQRRHADIESVHVMRNVRPEDRGKSFDATAHVNERKRAPYRGMWGFFSNTS